jgi:dTDP-glucose 4,6-dehydratase
MTNFNRLTSAFASPSFPCNPITTYGKAKRIAENLCIHSDVNSVVARCFAFVGPGLPLNAHFAIGNFIRSCMRNEPIMIRGDGTPLRSYMYSSDLVEWLLRIMVNSKPGEIYNVGSDVPISMVDLAHRVRDYSGVDVEITVCQSSEGSQMPESYIPCTRKAMNELSLKLKFDLENSIQNTLHALSHEPSV